MHVYHPQQPLVCLLPNRGVARLNADQVSPRPTRLAGRRSVSPVHITTDETLSRLAAAAVQQQHYPQALQLLSELIERHPQSAMYYSNRGLVHLRMGQPWLALADCDQAVELGPHLDQAYNNRAMCQAALGDDAAAVDDYEHAVDLNPFNSRARINLGATLRQMGDFDRALECLDEALMFHQLPEFIYAERGRTYHLRGDWNCALADYQRALDTAAGLPCSPQQQALIKRVKAWMVELIPQRA